MTNAGMLRMLCTVAMTFLISVAAAQVSPWQEKNEAGNVAAQAGRYAEAEKLYLAAIKAADAFDKTDSRLAISLANLATVYHLQKKYPEAKAYYQSAIKIWEKSVPPEPLLLASTLDRLAVLYRDILKFDQAEECAKRTVELRISKLGNQHLDVADALEDLGLVYFLQGTSVRTTNPKLGSSYPTSAGDISVGSRQRGMTAYEETAEYANMPARSPEEDRKSLASLVAGKSEAGLFPWNSSAAFDKGKLSKAAANYRQALDIREKLLGSAHPVVAKNLAALAEVFMALRDYTTAAPLLLRLTSIEEKVYGPADMRRVPTLRKYSYALTMLKQPEEAGRVDAQLFELLAKNRKP